MKKLSLILAFLMILGIAAPVLANDYPIYTEEKEWALGVYEGEFDGGKFSVKIYEKDGVLQGDVELKGFLDEDLSWTDLVEVPFEDDDDDRKIKIYYKKSHPEEIEIEMELNNDLWEVEIEEENGEEKEIEFVAYEIKDTDQEEERKDLPSKWAKEEVEKAIEENLVPEDLQDDYTDAIDREDFAELAIQVVLSSREITREELEKEVKDKELEFKEFIDCDDDDVLLASALGIVNGDGEAGTYRPEDSISREEAAVLLNNLLHYLLDDTDLILLDVYINYEDSEEISNWADGPIQVMAKVKGHNKSIMGGKENNLFDPKGTYTVEEGIISTYRLAGAVDQLK